MNDQDLNKIIKAFDSRLKPLVGDVAKIKRELSDIRMNQYRNYNELTSMGKDISRIDTTLETLNEDLEKHGKTLRGVFDQVAELTEDITEVKDNLKSLISYLKGSKQQLDQNTDSVKKINKRVGAVEAKSGIVPPPELTIVD